MSNSRLYFLVVRLNRWFDWRRAVRRSELLRAIQQEIRRHDLDTFVDPKHQL